MDKNYYTIHVPSMIRDWRRGFKQGKHYVFDSGIEFGEVAINLHVFNRHNGQNHAYDCGKHPN